MHIEAVLITCAALLSSPFCFVCALVPKQAEIKDVQQTPPPRTPPPNVAVAGGLTWPFLHQGIPDVYIHFMPSVRRKTFEQWVYAPISFTLGSAFAELGANVAYLGPEYNAALLYNVERSLHAGTRPIIFALAFWSSKATEETRETLRWCGKLGAFIVLFQSEVFAWVGQAHSNLVSELAKEFQASEVWDFNLANVDFMRESNFNPNVTLRYFPPGYVKELDLGVDFRHRLRNESMLGFMGRWHARPRNITEAYGKELGRGRIASTETIDSAEELWSFVSMYPMQLNVHHAQNCCPSTNAVESFRFAQLLPNKACVISARSYPSDEAEWKDIIHFVDVQDTAAKVAELARDVDGCQEKAYAAYKEKFNPMRLLKESGFDKVWRRLRGSG